MNKIAIIETGGKQYKVSTGDIVKIEKIKGEYSEGDKVIFDKVILIDDGENSEIGAPYLEKKVDGTIEKIGKGKKVDVVHFKSKSRHFKRYGHRQPFFSVRILSIK